MMGPQPQLNGPLGFFLGENVVETADDGRSITVLWGKGSIQLREILRQGVSFRCWREGDTPIADC